MKKFLALMIAVVMAFSMVAIPVSAADVNAEVEKVETTVEEAFTFAEKLANAIHKLVGDILAVFDKECPFCEEATIEKALLKCIPPKKAAMLDFNKKAIELGRNQ